MWSITTLNKNGAKTVRELIEALLQMPQDAVVLSHVTDRPRRDLPFLPIQQLPVHDPPIAEQSPDDVQVE